MEAFEVQKIDKTCSASANEKERTQLAHSFKVPWGIQEASNSTIRCADQDAASDERGDP